MSELIQLICIQQSLIIKLSDIQVLYIDKIDVQGRQYFSALGLTEKVRKHIIGIVKY
jgi:hypothetical protein